MCTENGFAEQRIRNGAAKLAKAAKASTQGRMDSYFKVMPGSTTKRKALAPKKGAKGGAKGAKKVRKAK